ncbi:alpha/beta hydrolase [Chryseobacterium lacus]|uniref:Alpha/beta hydrolase n=2 Tax=Chryseobacterium lacus TaxID=2058346 RepID=A0A368MYM2_9FLAO|nr:alpha/beta hydrolase [Chryseobacterium lacus]RST26973.1 alpha/beta hydrolase [Chryseobacterium lacus]
MIKKSFFHFLLMLTFPLLLLSCNTKHRIWVGKGMEQKIFNLKYGEHRKQNMDIFLPAYYTPDTPVVLLIHGGFWKFGRKQKMIQIQNFLHRHRIPTVNINYRLVSKKQKISYREQLEDIALSIEKFNSLSRNAGLMSNHYILLGESSGAHLALLYGYRNPNQVKKIISLSGPSDFYTSGFLNSVYSRYTSPTIEDVVGEKFNRKKLSEKFKEASPISQVAAVPTLIFQGDRDVLVHKSQGIALDSVLTAMEVPHRFIFMKKTGHTPRLYSKKKRDSIILPAILDWIQN